jgi:DNA-binding transcriptional LysR family regulator
MLNEINLSRIDLNLLVLFAIVLEERHVGRAAERLNLTPSAVSHGLKRLRRLLNDPLFLRTPKGMVPTARAVELEESVADVLVRVRSIVSTAETFDPARSTRRFMIGAPDGVSAVFLPSLLANLQRSAPGIDIGVRQLLPPHKGRALQRAWEPVLEELEIGTLDVAIVPLDEVPARFVEKPLYEESFVIATRMGHPLSRDPTLDRYCEMQHLVVSLTGDPHGLFDDLLAGLGRSRRVAVTVPNFMQAMLLVAETDLVAALPRRLAATHAERLGLTLVEPPLPRGPDKIRAIATKAAMMDQGTAWLFGFLQRMLQAEQALGSI